MKKIISILSLSLILYMQKTSSLGITSDLGWSHVYEPTTNTYLRAVYK